jgi:L-ascorbate metabolism protein UlaG (beta-lactamase superfamily)
MRRVVPKDVSCTLSRGGASVTLDADDLRALAVEIADGRAGSLSSAAERDLFVSGMLVPEAMQPRASTDELEAIVAAHALDPWVGFEAGIRVSGVDPRGVDPGLATVLSPAFLEVVTGLYDSLAEDLGRAVRSAAIRARTVSAGEWRRLAETIVRRWLAAHPEHADVVGLRETTEGMLLEPRWDRALVDEPADVTAVIALSHGERSEQHAIPMGSWPAVSAVMDALAGRRRADLASSLRDPYAAAWIKALQRFGALVSAADRPAAFPRQATSTGALAITPMGHATLLVDTASTRVLFDPTLFARDPRFLRQPLGAAELGEVHAIFLTHHHVDHIDPQSLLVLPKRTPVFVPRRSARPFDPPLARFVRAWGFERVVEIEPWSEHALGDLKITAIPFFGEASDRLGFSGSTFAVESHGRRALLLADSSPSQSGSSVLDAGVLDRVGPIDALFTTWWQERQFVWQLSPLAVFTLPSAHWGEATESCDLPVEFFARMVRATGAKRVFTYAEQGSEGFLPPHLRSTYIESISAFWSPITAYASAAEAAGARFEEATPFGTIHI